MAVLTILSIAVFAQDTTSKKTKKHKTEKAQYVCPVHPEVMMEKSGKCPKCGADLNRSPKENMKRDVMKIYACPVHPDETSDKPGNCPQCKSKMNLTSKEKMKMEVMQTYTCRCIQMIFTIRQAIAQNAVWN